MGSKTAVAGVIFLVTAVAPGFCPSSQPAGGGKIVGCAEGKHPCSAKCLSLGLVADSRDLTA